MQTVLSNSMWGPAGVSRMLMTGFGQYVSAILESIVAHNLWAMAQFRGQ